MAEKRDYPTNVEEQSERLNDIIRVLVMTFVGKKSQVDEDVMNDIINEIRSAAHDVIASNIAPQVVCDPEISFDTMGMHFPYPVCCSQEFCDRYKAGICPYPISEEDPA